MRFIDYTLTGLTPLLMHRDDVEASDDVQAWLKDPANKSAKKGGDDRAPAWTWQTYLYHDGKQVSLPAANVTASLVQAGALIPYKRQQTYLKLVAPAFQPLGSPDLDFATGPSADRLKAVPVSGLGFKDDGRNFTDQKKHAAKLGFDLHVIRAKLPNGSKVVRVRPRFAAWRVGGRYLLKASEDHVPTSVVETLFKLAGTQVGLCDWRPGSPKRPGSFGQFQAAVKVTAATPEAIAGLAG